MSSLGQVQVPTEVVVMPTPNNVPTGVYSIGPQKIRRQTPAPVQSHSIQKSGGFGKSGTYGLQLPLVSEEDDGSASDNEGKSSGMSSAAQAAALSAFLSVNSSDSDEAETQARITDVYREPLDLDGLENLILSILRTGKLTIHGTPGDVTKVQPALFALQANEKEIPQLLPQVIQSPLFNPINSEVAANTSNTSLPSCAYDLLQNGQIRIGIYIDTAIYTLLKSHCVKNAKQAEAIITTLMAANYIPVDVFSGKVMPPMIFQSSMVQSPRNGTRKMPKSTTGIERNSGSSLSSTTSGASFNSSLSNSSIENGISGKEEARDKFSDNSPLRTRRHSRVLPRPLRSLSNSSDDEGIPSIIWKTSIIDNSTLVCQYGNSSNTPLLMWNPKLTIDFHVKSSLGPLCGIVTGVDPSNRVVTVKIFNNSPYTVAFSIRSFRQSTIFTSHVVYPTKGLHILEKGESWEDNVELYPVVKVTTETFVIDLLLCTMDEHPCWNVQRKYAAMRAVKSDSSKTAQHLTAKRMTKKRASVFYMPGTKDQKEENMKLIISHGLQCVVKGKLDEAEVIFTQALLLPDFQRIELKSFVYICLAVVANKRQNKGYYDSLLPVLNEVSAANQLVDAVEATPGAVRMPRMMQLVKQLKKELDVHKIFTDFRQKSEAKKLPRVDDVKWKESETVTQEGSTLSCNSTTVCIQPDSISAPTHITVSAPDMGQLNSMLRHSGWDSTIKIIAAVNIDCNPVLGHFRNPLKVTTTLPKKCSPPAQCLRLVHSNYLRHWCDITDDPHCSVEINGDTVLLQADRPGWLAVTSIQFDPSLIVVKAMQSLSVEPIMLHFSVYGLSIPDTNIFQIATFISPRATTKEKPKHHAPIAFTHTTQAYPGERLRLTFLGQLEPETSMNEKDLSFEFTVNETDTSVCEKWLRLTSAPEVPLNGKMVISCCRRTVGEWDSISELRLSTKTGFVSSENPANS